MSETRPLVEEQLAWGMDDRVAYVLREWDFAFATDDDRERIARVVLNMGGVPDLLAALTKDAPMSTERASIVSADSLPLDPGIARAVEVLHAAGIDTFESCEGGDGHSYAEPTVRFHGGRAEGFRAFTAAGEVDLPVSDLRRVWPVIDGEPTGPYWELTFRVSEGTPNKDAP